MTNLTHQRWLLENRTYRRATLNEIAELQAMEGAPHVTFACERCGNLTGAWSAKNLALSNAGHYNGCRNIFHWHGEDCGCPGSALVCVVVDRS